jgi:cytochrome c biogenesis protein CcmG/thiol:disulfide interchange protein DsbE
MATSSRLTPRRLAAGLAGLLIAIQIALVAYDLQIGHRPEAGDGFAIPPFSLARLDAPERFVTDRDLATGHVSLLNFFASWCGPCEVENPLLMEIKATAPIVGIDYLDRPKAAERYLAKLGNPYTTIGADTDGKAMSAFGFDSIPSTLIVDKTGKIVYVHRGRLRQEDVDTVILPMIARLSR